MPTAQADDTTATGTLSGRVYSPYARGYVVEQPVIVRFRTTGGLDLGTTHTDDEGRFVLEDVPVGFHRIVAWRRGEGSRPLPEIAVRPGETVREMAVVLEPQGVVRLRVETPSGRPATVERVQLERPPQVVDGHRGKRDTWELRVMTEGSSRSQDPEHDWRLVVHAKGFRTYVENLRLADYDRVYRTVELKSGHSLLGTVVDDATGEPIEGAEVERIPRLRPLDDGARWTTGPRGRFDLPGAAAGRNTFRARAPGYEATLEKIDLGERFITRHVFRLTRLTGDGAVTGRVVGERGRGRGGLEVVAIPTNRRHPKRRATTGDDGSFRIERLEGGLVTVTVEDPNDEIDADFVTARPGGQPLRLTVRRLPVLRVTAADEEGRAPELWRVRWRLARAEDDVQRGSVEMTRADESARIVLPAPGAATVTLDVPGRVDPDPIELEARSDEEHPVAFTVTGPAADARLLGWVMRRDDIPLDVPFSLWLRHPDGRLERLETNALGGYRRRHLAAGRYTLLVTRGSRRPDETSRRVSADLVSGRPTRLDLPADAALVITKLGGPEGSPLRPGDALVRVAGARMTAQRELDELIEYFQARKVRVELVRDGELREVWVESSHELEEHTYVERMR